MWRCAEWGSRGWSVAVERARVVRVDLLANPVEALRPIESMPRAAHAGCGKVGKVMESKNVRELWAIVGERFRALYESARSERASPAGPLPRIVEHSIFEPEQRAS
jgi:hypothetical protein